MIRILLVGESAPYLNSGFPACLQHTRCSINTLPGEGPFVKILFHKVSLITISYPQRLGSNVCLTY